MSLAPQPPSPTNHPLSVDALPALRQARSYLQTQMHPEGCVAGEVVWCPMLAAQYVLLHHITEQPIQAARREQLRRYFSQQQKSDGGYGLHSESHSYLYVTTLSYVALRLLGVDAAASPCREAKAWLDAQDVLEIPTWGKFWLAMVGLYDYEGVHPIQPEMWLLPAWTPIHPRRFYCHTRLIYMGFSYLYGVRLQGALTPTIQALRGELYGPQYDTIDWPKQRNRIAETDLYVAPGRLLQGLNGLAGLAERVLPQWLRKRALADVLDRVLYEQHTSHFVGISPVNGMLNTLVLWHAQHDDFQASLDGIAYWTWEDDEEGFRIAGASSHTWDTAFTAQALMDGPLFEERPELLARMGSYFQQAQIQNELPGDFGGRYFRLPSLGGWCFGDPTHHWPVSDCTAEALIALTRIQVEANSAPLLSKERRVQAVRFLLARHNEDGGWGSYEAQRGNRLLERLNPAEMFGNCMSEYSYLECTASCMQALSEVLRTWPHLLPSPLRLEAQRQIERGAQFIAERQEESGAWPGFWGVNYTYGTLFVVSGLLAANRPDSESAIERACEWLLAHRLPDGGWGEDIASCAEGHYIPLAHSQAIQTAWAMMTLLRAEYVTEKSRAALHEAAALLLAQQNPDGTWERGAGAGIFFNTAALHYDLYRLYFPMWALGLYAKAQHQGLL